MQNQNDAFCPSFSSYSNTANVAVKLIDQHRYSPLPVNDDDNNFEFTPKESPVNTVFPLFNRDLLLDNKKDTATVSSGDITSKAAISPARRSLKKMFVNDRDNDSSTSDDEDEIEPSTTSFYCAWSPRTVSPSPEHCKKSNSTGNSSKRWRFLRDLLKRSHSDGGKEAYELVNNSITSSPPSKIEMIREDEKKSPDNHLSSNVKAKAKCSTLSSSPSHLAFYKTEVDKKKRKSYLPYKTFLGSFPYNHNNHYFK
ncbi:hypothetical protein ACFE04_009793 [Oxalis oulophora]